MAARRLHRRAGLSCRRGQLRPGGTFVDIGANIGSQTIYAMLSGHHARALAVEPVPANAKLLRMNMMLNGLEDRVGTVESAAGRTDGSVVLSINPTNSGMHSSRRSFRSGETMTVPVAPMDAIAALAETDPESISLIWIDAEGAEPDVIAGMGSILAAAPPLVLEWNKGLYGAHEVAEMIEAFSPGYEGFVRLGDIMSLGLGAALHPIGELAVLNGQLDIVIVPRAKTS